MQWTRDGVAICTAAEDKLWRTLVIDGAGGAIVTWSDGRSGAKNKDIYAQQVNANGQLPPPASGILVKFNFTVKSAVVREGQFCCKGFTDDLIGATTECSRMKVKTPDSIDADPLSVIYRYELLQNYPNPFNPQTVIQYMLPEKSHVLLQIMNVNGQLIRTLEDRFRDEGIFEVQWDGTDRHGRRICSGIYLYKLETENFVKTMKMLIIE